jgi:hypothetical protein
VDIPTSKALRFQSAAKVLYWVTIALMWILAAIALIAFICSIVVALIPAERLGNYSGNSLGRFFVFGAKSGAEVINGGGRGSDGTGTFHGMDFLYGQSVQLPAGAPLKPIILSISLFTSPLCLLCAAIALFLGRILKAVARGRPFEPDNGKALLWIAICIPALYLFYFAAGFLTIEYLIHSIGLSAHCVFSLRLDALVLPTLLLLILSGVFRYGSELQRDADETI